MSPITLTQFSRMIGQDLKNTILVVPGEYLVFPSPTSPRDISKLPVNNHFPRIWPTVLWIMTLNQTIHHNNRGRATTFTTASLAQLPLNCHVRINWQLTPFFNIFRSTNGWKNILGEASTLCLLLMKCLFKFTQKSTYIMQQQLLT